MNIVNILKRPLLEYQFFLEKPEGMRVLLATNMIYAFVLPVIEIFIGAYIMRSSNDPKIVAMYQLAVYSGIPITFLVNGYLLSRFKISTLYSIGMLLSGISMFVMMGLDSLNLYGILASGVIMGASFGLFWANRDFLALQTTNDANRNYYYGVETFFYTIAAIVVPFLVGWFLSNSIKNEWFRDNISQSYQVVAIAVFILTILSSIVIHRHPFKCPEIKKFIFFKFDGLWRKLLVIAGLKGMIQGYLVTAPAILVMRLVGDEGSLGELQSISGILTACLLYLIGRVSKPKHRIYIFTVGLLVFLFGTVVNGILFSAIGVIVFVLCKVVFQPLHDIAYFPVQMRVIDVVSKKEKRHEFAYIFNHEFGLYVGRVMGLGMFILLAYNVSEIFALKYALIVVALIQLLAIPLMKIIIKITEKYEMDIKKTTAPAKKPAINIPSPTYKNI
ncbi:MAG: MFS transporter [Flavobacteriaceae bacterium]|nr:MFS transporter [Flavobacteriaceae bacterium]